MCTSSTFVALEAGRPQTACAIDDLAAVHPGQHDVEDDDLRSPALEQLEALVSGRRAGHVVPVPLEGHADEPRDGFIVLDDEDAQSAGPPRVASAWASVSSPSGRF